MSRCRFKPGRHRAGTDGNLTSDAHVGAIAIEHGAEICSTDNNFGRFDGLRSRNSLFRLSF
jgi:predicted nucleic acid-binding protein